MVDYCMDYNIILQPVVACNHTVHAWRASLAALSQTVYNANKATRFCFDATLDLTCKRNILWAKHDEHEQLSTSNTRMQPAFARSYQTVAILFGSRVIGYLSREHPLVKNGSFRDQFIKGTYLRANIKTQCIWMYCIALGSELLVQDYNLKSYPNEFPLRDPSCLLGCTQTILKDLVNMHIEDAHHDKMVAEETALQIHTRAQSRAAQTVSIIEATRASSSPSLDPTADPIDHSTESVMPPRSAHASTRATDEITIRDNLHDFSILAISRALLKHSVEFILLVH